MAALLCSPSILSLRAYPSLFSSPNLRFFSPPRLRLIQIQASVSEFDISFSLPKTQLPPHKTLTLVPDPNTQNPNANPSQPQSGPLLIPWIVRDENGNLKLQSTPPAPFLHAMAEAKESALKKESSKKTTKKKDLKAAAAAASAPPSSSPPLYSKAARRFYNQKIREPQRLSKVLAAAGVASRRSCEELIFGGKVTVNGSVCTSPQVHEGRNHEVRELVKNAGLQLYSLKRVRIGGFRLPSDLGLGKYVELKQSDLKLLGGAAENS